MKANEAPERIYVHKSQYWGLMANEYNMTKYDIEYTRTDAFIEKAVVWISNNCYIPHSTLESFKKYMKGE